MPGQSVETATAERLANLMAVFRILSWRVLWLTMLSRTWHEAPPSIAFTDNEIGLLDRLVGDADSRRAKPGTLGLYFIALLEHFGHELFWIVDEFSILLLPL